MKESYALMVIIFITSRCLAYESCDQRFDKYVKDFQKIYKDDQSREKHKGYFCENLKKIQECQKNESLNYTCGINSRTDYPQIVNLHSREHAGEKEKEPPRLRKKTKQTSQANRTKVKDEKTLKELDWRNHGVITSIKDQGECGSCWAFTAVAAAESLMIISGLQNSTIDLSEQFLLHCTPDSDCEGGFMEEVMKVVVDRGLPHEEDYPYNPLEIPEGICCSISEELNGQCQASNWYHITDENEDLYDLTDEELIELLQDGPIVSAVVSSGWIPYESGIFFCEEIQWVFLFFFWIEIPAIDHAVQIVGYTEKYWIVKNQWGTLWGQNGYMRITRNRTHNCGIGRQVHIFPHDNNLTIPDEPDTPEKPDEPDEQKFQVEKLFVYLTICIFGLILV